MKTELTIRNCPKEFRFVCPKNWDELTPTQSSGVRHCGACKRDVHFCVTNEDTIKHAKAGHCIAREVPNQRELPSAVLGMPTDPDVPEPEQEVAERWFAREAAIDDSIKNADADRSCPQCNYPAPRWRITCRVCGFKMGRVLND